MLEKRLNPASILSSKQLSYRGDIDGLRAIALLLILCYHLQAPGFSGGFVGVDLFFVISGFLITSIVMSALDSGSFRLAQFMVNRAFRLVPSLLVMLCCTVLGAAATLSIVDMKQFGASLLASLSFAGNFYFNQHSGYFDADSSTKPLLHLWSLGVEVQFYLLWPLVLMFASRMLARQQLLILVVVLAVASIATLPLLLPTYPNAAFYLLPSRLFEFMIGAVVVWLPRIRDAAQNRIVSDICMLGGLLLLTSLHAVHSDSGFSYYHTLGACIGAALLLYGAPASTATILLNNTASRYIGRISYELYLFHWPLIALYTYITPGSLSAGEQGVLALATFGLAMLTYYCVGRPLRYAYKQPSFRSTALFASLAFTFILACAGVSMLKTNGWAWRLPDDHRLFITDLGKFHGSKFGGMGYPENKVLVIGDTASPPSLILIGDSYAGQYASALDELLKENRKSAYLYHVNGCLLIPGGSVRMLGHQTNDCLSAHLELETLLSKHPLPVIHAQSWESYKEGVYSIAADGQRVTYMQPEDGNYYDKLLTTIAQMQTYLGNRTYTVVGIAPGIDDQQPIARCLAGPMLFTKACQQQTAAPENTRLTGQPFNQHFAQYVASHPGIEFLNPRSALCRDGYCYALEDGRVLYSDRSHLTKDGAKKVLLYYNEMLFSQ